MTDTPHSLDAPDSQPTREGVERARAALRMGHLEAVAHLLGEDPAALATLSTTPDANTPPSADTP